MSRPSHAVTAKKCAKKRDARAKLLFCHSKPIPFLPFSLTSPSSLFKLPIVFYNGKLHVPKRGTRTGYGKKKYEAEN